MSESQGRKIAMGSGGYPYQMALFLITYYTTNCMYQSYMSLYYTSIRFDSSQIGLINAAVALVSLASQPLWGLCGDRTKNRSRLIAMLALASGASALAFRLTSQYIPLLLLACLFSCFYTSIQPMGDSIILRELEARHCPFGPLRLTACAAFAIAGVVFGWVLDGHGRAGWIPLLTAALCGVTAISTLSLPKTAGGQAAGGRRMSFGALLKDRDLMLLLGFMTPVQITMGYFYTFFSPHFVSLPGGSSSLLGACYLIAACSEVPFLLLADRLFDKYGAGRLMCVSAASLSIRWLIMAVSGSVPIVMFSQIFHGWGFIVMTVCMAKYINRSVPAELQASGQMLLAVVSFGIARVAGNLGGGLLADAIGRQNVYYIAAALCLTALCGFAPYYLKRKPLNGLHRPSSQAR